MTSEIILQELNILMKKVMDKFGVCNYKLEVDGKSEVGDNYMGEVIFFRIIPDDDNKDTYNFVMKTAKRSDELRNAMPVENVYNRELFMYSKIFPYFRNFIEEVNPDFEFDCLPEVYWIDTSVKQETLILDNLKTKGYKLYDRKKPWNLEHSLFVMENYGKYHALSFAIRDQKPQVFEDLTKNMTNVFEAFATSADLGKFYDEPLENVMKLLEKAGRGDLVPKFDSFQKEIANILMGPTEECDKLVILHADCWNNNFMFKYLDDDETKPSKMCFLDFQLSTVDSPVKDLAYNIYATCDKSCLDHLDLLLETYYKSLSKSVKALGSDLDSLLTYEQFLQHWKKYSRAGVLISTVIIKVELIDKADVPDMVKLAEEGKKIEDCFDFNPKNIEEYNRRVLDVFIHYGDKFL